jgi:hypothetical protein
MPDRIPPEWAVGDARRLTMEEFGQAFGESWRGIRSQLYKVEAWQTYQEPQTESLHAFQRGDFGAVEQLILAEAEIDGFVYEDVRTKDIPFVRLRLVKKPLSAYLRWEFWNYEVRERLGETVLVIDRTEDGKPLPNSSLFDFLLFDDRAALVHDYGTDGLQVGGWLVSSEAVLARLTEVALSLKEESTPLDAFIETNQLDRLGKRASQSNR